MLITRFQITCFARFWNDKLGSKLEWVDSDNDSEVGVPVNGILLLDKPTGITSNAALQTAKRLFDAKKAGHTGSLDPLASGMLPLCFGHATKFSQYLLNADKVYVVTAKLGEKTETGDSEGEVVSRREVSALSESDIEAVLRQFRGEIDQVPSMYSALKHQGQPLYKLARQGVEVERPARKVSIYELTLKDVTQNTLELYVKCSKGTYIRTLVEDIGERIGCGAHVIELRRLSVGGYEEAAMVTLDTLKALADEGQSHLDKTLLPLSSAVADWTIVELSEAAAFYLKQGQAVIVPGAPTEGWVQLFLNDDEFIGVGEVLSDGKIAPRRLTV